MRKLIVSLLLVFGSFVALAQDYQLQSYVPNPFTTPTINVTNNQSNNGWGVIGQSCAGCPSYFYKVTRTTGQLQAEDGVYYYYYYFWFFSNSYYSNAQPASTYLTDVKAYMNGIYITGRSYALVTRQEKYFIWMRSTSGSNLVTFNVTKMSVY